MYRKTKTICNLGVKPTQGMASYQVFRMPNGAWQDAQYQIDDRFDVVEYYPSGKMLLRDSDGDLIYVPAGENQCFQEVDNARK
jgi:hypothetical protein